MAFKLNTKTARIDLDISVEAQLRFAEIHKALGFKTKPETFEAIIYSVSMRDKIDPGILDRVESKLDHALEKTGKSSREVHRSRAAGFGIPR